MSPFAGSSPGASVGRALALRLWGGFVYLLSLLSFAWFAFWIRNGWAGDPAAGFGIDAGRPVSFATAVLVDGLLMVLFAAYHSVGARLTVKARLARWIPAYIDRSVYNFVSSIMLIWMCEMWLPLNSFVWQTRDPETVVALDALYVLAWVTMFAGILLIHHNEFFGLRQIELAARGMEYVPLDPGSPARYALARVPLMLGLIAIPWATHTMSEGRFYFSVVLTAYCVLGSFLSKRDRDQFNSSGHIASD